MSDKDLYLFIMAVFSVGILYLFYYIWGTIIKKKEVASMWGFGLWIGGSKYNKETNPTSYYLYSSIYFIALIVFLAIFFFMLYNFITAPIPPTYSFPKG